MLLKNTPRLEDLNLSHMLPVCQAGCYIALYETSDKKY